MRIFISLIDETGSKRTTRITLNNCTNTSQLIKQICSEIRIPRSHVIIKMKYDPENLRIVENWQIGQYPIKNGSTFLVEYNQMHIVKPQSSQNLQKIQQQNEQSFTQGTQLSFCSDKSISIQSVKIQRNYINYYEQCLVKMLEAVREGNLQQISKILKEEPQIQDERQFQAVMKKKMIYLLNQLGDCGRNALHWAIHINHPDIVSFLIIKGTDPTVRTIDDYTPLQLAVQHHSPEIMKLLLEQKKLDINQVTSKGTALHLAIVNQDRKCLQLLLQSDVDIDVKNSQQRTALDLCKNQQIKRKLQKRAEMKKMPIPTLTKGRVYKVSSMTYRLKEKTMLLNPFKNEFILRSMDGDVEQQGSISSIQSIEKIVQRSWLMSDNVNYFKIHLKDDTKQLLLGIKHTDIYKKWIDNFRHAQRFIQYSLFMKVVPISLQVVQILDDQTNLITLYKRKEEDKSRKKSQSIMNLKVQKLESNAIINQKIKQLKDTQQDSEPYLTEEQSLRESQIILGSVLQLNPVNRSAPPKLNYQRHQSQQPELDLTKYRFRKNSDQKVEVVSEFKSYEKSTISYEDFVVKKQLGNGAFGHVYLAQYKKNGKLYALKVLNKKKLVSKKHLKYAVGEANILKKMNSPFVIKLYFTFQTPTNLYMALDNCSNGDLSELITSREKLSLSTARFIIAQLILAVEYLHKEKILYRDLKPENILIASDGYIRLTDFGLSRENSFSMSFCGSPAYLSPEMLDKKGVGFSSDIYGIGCVLYEMVVGMPPFFDENIDNLFENIKNGKLRYPSYLSIEIKSLISKLLQRDVNKRLGVKDISQIKKHDFFRKFDWNLLQSKQLKPPSQMFENQQDDYFGMMNLQSDVAIRLVDNDYNESTQMINRIKNFTFFREEEVGIASSI